MNGRTVLVAFSQPLLRAGLRAILAGSGFDVVAEAADAAEAVAAAKRHRPAACIVDTELAGGGLMAIQAIAAETRVLGTAATVGEDEVVAAIQAGASGLLPLSTAAPGFVRALEAVIDGEAAVPRAMVGRLIDEVRGVGGRRGHVGGNALWLTPRETQVLRLVRDGMTTREIAHDLGVSPVTVRRHVGAISAKAGPTGQGELRRRRRAA